ncbi:hypothetical protein Tco_1384101 [Tanacetum coccineum]
MKRVVSVPLSSSIGPLFMNGRAEVINAGTEIGNAKHSFHPWKFPRNQELAGGLQVFWVNLFRMTAEQSSLSLSRARQVHWNFELLQSNNGSRTGVVIEFSGDLPEIGTGAVLFLLWSELVLPSVVIAAAACGQYSENVVPINVSQWSGAGAEACPSSFV